MASITVDQLQVLITANAKDLDSKLSRIAGQLEDSGKSASKFGKVSTVAFGAIAGAAAALANKGINAITNSIDGAIKRIDTLDNSARTFANMGIKVDDAKKAMANLEKSITGLPTPLDSAVRGMTALTATYGDVDKGQKVFSALNNAILGFGGSTNEVENAITQLSQLPMDGPLDAQTWNSLRNSGLTPVITAIAKDMGMGVAEMKKAFGEGELTVADFTDALVKMDKDGGGGMKSLEKIAKDSTKGIGTGFANMKTAITRGMADIIKSIGSAKIASAISNIGKAFEAALKQVGTFIKGAMEVGTTIISHLKPAFDAVYNSIVGSFIPAIQQAMVAIQPYVQIIGTALVGALFLALQATSAIITGISGLISAVTSNATVFGVLVGAIAGVTAAFVIYNTTLKIVAATKAALIPLTSALTAVHTLQTAGIGTLRAAWIVLNAVMLANPIGLVIAAVGALIGIIAALSLTTDNQTAEERELNDQRDRSIRLANELKRSEDELKGAKDNVKDASLRQERALRTYNDMLKQHGKDALETREAARQLEKAEEALKEANNRVKSAVDSNTAAIQAQKGEMDGLNKKLQNFNGKTFTYYIQGVEHAVQKGSDGKNYVTPTFATGGFTGRGGKYEMAGIVHKGEYVLPKELVNQTTGLPKSFTSDSSMDSFSDNSQPLIINVGGERLIDTVIEGINGRSFLGGASVINV